MIWPLFLVRTDKKADFGGIENMKYAMKNERLLEKFIYELERGDRRTMSFGELCGKTGAAPRRFDRYLKETFGMSGEEIIEVFRKGIPVSMMSCAAFMCCLLNIICVSLQVRVSVMLI